MIRSHIQRMDYLFRSLLLLQANWSLIKKRGKIYFVGEISGDFDEQDILLAEDTVLFSDEYNTNTLSLVNGSRLAEQPFALRSHANGRIFSSGKYRR